MATLKLGLIRKYHTKVTKNLVSNVQSPIQLLAECFEIMVAFKLNKIDFEIRFCDF